MKTAICFTGTGRSLEHTHKNIKKFLIDSHEQCDVFAHISATKHLGKVHQYFDFDEIANMAIEPDLDFDIDGLRWFPEWPAGLYSGPKPRQTYLNNLYARKRCGEILIDYCQKNEVTYDKVIHSRLDVEYYNFLDNIDLNAICVPDFHNFPHLQGTGCNDRLAVGNLENMKTYFDAYDRVREYVSAGGLLHAESFLGWHLISSQLEVKKYPIRFTRVRPNGFRQDERLKELNLMPADY
jgi:hypothetical protein